jgi:hypothetical protein
MATLGFVVKAPTFWGGVFALALGLVLGLRAPMPQGLLLIGLGAVAFVACLAGQLVLASYERTAPTEGQRQMVSAQSFHALLSLVRSLAAASARNAELTMRSDMEAEKKRRELYQVRGQFERISESLGRLADEARAQEQSRTGQSS